MLGGVFIVTKTVNLSLTNIKWIRVFCSNLFKIKFAIIKCQIKLIPKEENFCLDRAHKLIFLYHVQYIYLPWITL